MNRLILWSLVALLVLPAAQSVALPITTGAVADGYGQGPGTSSDTVIGGGTSAALWVRNGGGTANVSRKTWIRFDLTPYLTDTAVNPGVPATLELQRASTVPGDAGSDTLRVHGLNAGYVPSGGSLDTDWVETALTWNNGPGNNTSSSYLLNPSETTLINSFAYDHSSPAGASYSINLGDLTPFIQADNTVTLMLTGPPSGTTRMYLASLNDPSLAGPLLSFETVPPVPEPSSIFLLGFGSLSLMHFRRRLRQTR